MPERLALKAVTSEVRLVAPDAVVELAFVVFTVVVDVEFEEDDEVLEEVLPADRESTSMLQDIINKEKMINKK